MTFKNSLLGVGDWLVTGNAKPRGEGTGYLAPPRQLRRRLRFIGITLNQP